jgi:lactate permease
METVQVPVDLLHWVLAILPIVALLVFLVPLRWRAPEAGPMAMFTAAIVAVLAFRTPWDTWRLRARRAYGTPSSSFM